VAELIPLFFISCPCLNGFRGKGREERGERGEGALLSSSSHGVPSARCLRAFSARKGGKERESFTLPIIQSLISGVSTAPFLYSSLHSAATRKEGGKKKKRRNGLRCLHETSLDAQLQRRHHRKGRERREEKGKPGVQTASIELLPTGAVYSRHPSPLCLRSRRVAGKRKRGRKKKERGGEAGMKNLALWQNGRGK